MYFLFLMVCISYYIADCLVKAYEAFYLGQGMDMCKGGFFLHHMITIMGFKNLVIAADHFPWFM